MLHDTAARMLEYVTDFTPSRSVFDASTLVGVRFVLTIIVCIPAVKSSTKGVNILLPTAGGKLSNAPPAESWMKAFSVSINPSSLVSALGKSPGL